MKKICIAILTFILIIESLSRLSFYIFEVEPHQKYSLKRDDKKKLLKKVNGLGAIGEIYRGQAIRIAVFGTSPSLMPGVPFEDKWSEKIRKIIGGNRVHVDNFSIGNSQFHSLENLINSLLFRGVHYDFILINLTVQGIQAEIEQYRFHYSMRWTAEPEYYFKYLGLLLQSFNRNLKRDHHLRNVINGLSLNKAYAVGENTKKHMAFQGHEVYDKKFRQDPKYKKYFVELPFNEPKIRKINKFERDLKGLYSSLKKLGDNIFWSPVRISYSENMLPSYHKKLVFIKPAKNFNSKNPQFYNIKSLHGVFQRQADLLFEMLKKLDVEVLDWPKVVNEHLSHKENLYIDEFHLSSTGGEIAAQYIAEKIMQHPHFIKKKSR